MVFNGSYEGGALVDICKKYNLKVITIHHNYDPKYAYDNITIPIYKDIFRFHVFRLQKNAYKKSNINLFLTNDDLDECAKEYGETNALNAVLGVFEYQNVAPLSVNKKMVAPLTFVITGSLCTVQGVDSIKYFFQELYCYLPIDCKVIIAGRTPTAEVENLCSQYTNVCLIPNPKNMSEVISSGDIYICPTRLGGGLKLRVMDGLRLGLPVITHKFSARGYSLFENTDYFRRLTNNPSS